jgi:hypothetical protein
MNPFDDAGDLDLDARLRTLFADGDFDVAAPAGTDVRVLAGARRAQRRARTVRAVSAVAVVSAAAAAAATAGGHGDGTEVLPTRMQDPRCQEWWVPPTPSPGEDLPQHDYPTWTADPEPLGPQFDHFATSVPGLAPGATPTPKPMRGPHGGTLCTVVDGKADVYTREGYVWPTDVPVPTYSMFPGATHGMSVPPSFLPTPTDAPTDVPTQGRTQGRIAVPPTGPTASP